MGDRLRGLSTLIQHGPQTVLRYRYRPAGPFVPRVGKNTRVRTLTFGQVAAVLKSVGVTEPGEQHRESVADCRSPFSRLRVPTLRFVEAVPLAVHSPDAQRP